ncbi:MAG: DUF4845 domain-containing protein [Acidobacteriota bacterium]|nr:MAG: DUF4845 domain-containing protein [Acidobacteriota bacterium]
MFKKHSSMRGEGKTGAVIALFIAVAILYTAFKVIPVLVKTYDFAEKVETLSRRGASLGQTTEDDIRKRLLKEAERLDLPVRGEDIRIRLTAKRLKVEVKYAVPIDLAGFVYNLQREHKFEGHRFRL